MEYKKTESKKYQKPLDQIKFYRGNPNALHATCPNCGKVFSKQNGLQIVFFCSKSCRRSYREVPTKFIVEDKK